MPLPKIDVPVFYLDLPYSKLKVQYRPFTVKEEKILLFAQQSKDPKQIATAVKQVAENCITNDVRIEDMFTFEVDYFFLKLRSASVNNVIKLKLKEGEEEFYDVDVDLEEVELPKPSKEKLTIPLNEEYTMSLNYPKYGNVDGVVKLLNEDNAAEFLFTMMSECIESIYSEDEMFLMKDYTAEEKKEFLDSLTSKNFKDLQQFISKIPALEHEIKYINDEGQERSRVLRGLFDFFTFV